MAGITLLEDGTEVCLPVPDSWSDSDDEEEAPDFACPVECLAPCTAPVGDVPEKALATLASIAVHNHAERRLADPQSSAARSLAALAEEPPLPEHGSDVLPSSVTAVDFAARFIAGPGRPAVVQGLPRAEGWPAAERWRGQSEFLKHHGQLPVQVTELSAVHGLGRPFRVELPLADYAAYAGANRVDWPFYVWERNFTGPRRWLLEDFQAPHILEDDLYDMCPEVRDFLPLTCHLFVLVGGRRTGSNMHKDPKWSSAWNTLLCGRKRWVLFPRDTPAEEIGAMAGDAYKDGGPQAYWWLDHYPRLRQHGSKLGMVDILQCAGDTVFIPAGWWHATLNLPDDGEDVTVACTRNVLPPASLSYVLPCMQRADPAFTKIFVEAIHAHRPDVVPILQSLDCAQEPEPLACLALSPVDGAWRPWPVHRRAASSLSLAGCRREFIRQGQPVIINGLGPHMLSTECCGLSRDWLGKNFGEKCVAVQRNFRSPALRRSEEDCVELMPLKEVLALLRRGGPEVEGLYLYDLSLPLQLPGLLEHVRLPRYFAHCYLQQTMRQHCFSRSWPTLFIGAAGSQARLHVDQWHGHFWMHLISGRKKWTIFHPEDAHLLRPSVPEGRYHPVFPDLSELSQEQGEGSELARREDFVLEEGETLFVPGGAPHVVVNLTDTVAIAGNFLDESNYDAAMADICAMAAKEEADGPMAAVAAALDEMEFDPEKSLHEESLPPRFLVVRYQDFLCGRAAGWGARPEGEEV